MAFQRGDVLLVPFPFSDLSTTKVRPAVVVSGPLYHSIEPDLLLAGITSNVPAVTGPLDYILTDWRSAGLRYPSALKPVLFTLDPNRVLYRVGALTPTDLSEVTLRLRLALGL
jgi:mRNA interferase MazF